MTETKATKSMLISVGGSPDAIVKSIEMNRPETIVFFVSRGSYEFVTQKILPAVQTALGRIPPHEIVVTPDAQDVGESTFTLLREVSVALRKLGLDAEWPELVDFTGGTKPMSAALVWAASRFPCTFSYIGSDSPESRTKDGLGIVIGGEERCLLRENPWNAIAYYDVQQAVALFNGGQYANAVAALDDVIVRVSDPHRNRLLAVVCNIWRGYTAWDVFDHCTAVREFGANAQVLADLAPPEESLWPGLSDFAEASLECYKILQQVVGKKPEMLSWANIHDLLANAARRARLEHKYEDATARCYSAIEKYGKHALQLRCGINNSKCRPEQLPETLHAEYVRLYTSEKDAATLSFGLQATYRILVEVGDSVGLRFMEVKSDLDKLLPLRNNSILGHGCIPIKSENFEKLFDTALRLMDLDESELTQFPQF